MPARASVLTERFVRDHGVFENSAQVADGTPTFLHRIRDAGYHTAEIGKMHLWPHGQRENTDRRDARAAGLVRLRRSDRDRWQARSRGSTTPTIPNICASSGLLESYREFIGRSPRRQSRGRSGVASGALSARARGLRGRVARRARREMDRSYAGTRRFSCGSDFRDRMIRGTRRAKRSSSIAPRKFPDAAVARIFLPFLRPVRST